jgi:hypothetical protein
MEVTVYRLKLQLEQHHLLFSSEVSSSLNEKYFLNVSLRQLVVRQ